MSRAAPLAAGCYLATALVGFAAAVALTAVALAAESDSPARQIQEGPTGYTVACALTEQRGIRSCADLPAAAACTHEADFASHTSTEATGMTFVNRSSQTLALYWLDFQGNRRLYASLPPDGRASQATYIGHNWLLATTQGECIGIFKAAPESLAFF